MQSSDRLNRIPRAQPVLCPLCHRITLALLRWPLRRTLRRLQREISALRAHMDADAALAESLKREYKTSPTLRARMVADELVLATLERERSNTEWTLRNLEAQQ